MLLLMVITAGAYAEDVKLIDYPTSQDGITLSGTTATGTVKIHANKDAVKCITLKNGFTTDGKMNGNHIKLTVDGGLKAGDVVTIAGAISNKDASKRATAVLFSADETETTASVIKQFSDFINCLTAEEDPVEESYTLEKDYDVLYLGRDGGTGANLTLITLTRQTNQKKLTLSFPEASYTVREGEAFEAPQLNYAGVTDEEFTQIASQIIYTSEDEGVATVDANGAVTIVAEGTTTITAAFAGNDNIMAADASYKLTVIDKYAPAMLIDYPNTKDGTSLSGTTVDGTVSINKKDVPCYSLKNSYVDKEKKTGNHIELKIDGGFKKGDVLTVSGCFNTDDAAKRGTVVLFSDKEDGTINKIKTFEDFINLKQTSELVEQSFTLEEDYDVLYLGRDGNTATHVTLITMMRKMPLFNETFDQINETGGNDDAFSGQVANKTMATTDATDEEWTSLDKISKGKQCAKFGTGSANGVMTTRVITLKGDGGLTFRAAGWSGGTNTLTVKAMDATGAPFVEKTITLTNSAWKDYAIALDNADGNMVLEFSGKRGFIDDIVVKEGKVVEKADIVLAFDPTELEVEMGNEFVEPVLSTPKDFVGTVTYSISNEKVATIDAATGKLTLVGAGTAKVTAKTSETDIYNEGEASYTLTVIENVLYDIAGIKSLTSGSVGTLKFDNAQVLFKGTNDMYVKDASGAIDFFKTTNFTYKEGDILNGTAKVTYTLYNGLPEITKVEDAEVTAADGTATPAAEEIANVTLEKYMCDLVKVKGTFKVNGRNFFVTDGTNEVQLYNKFDIAECDMSNVKDGAEVTATGIVIPFNGKPEIALTQLEVKEAEVVTAKITDAGYATLFYGTKALTVPAGVKAYTATVNEKSIVPGTTYNEGNVIPAGEAVILEGPAGEYEFEVDATNTDSPTTGNMLYGFDEDATTTGPAGSAFYKLAVGPQGVGFYYGATGGAAFTSAAHKAYLAVPESMGASFFLFETDGINVVKYGLSKNDVIYNLQGVRMDATNISKGIYIVNGKKMVVK